MRYTFILFFLFYSFHYAFGQDEIDQLFDKREFKEIITILKKKIKKEELTMDEYFYLIRSYGRTRQYTNGLLYTKEMERKCIKNKDTANLTWAYNLYAENLIDLNMIDDGVAFCDTISSVFRAQDSSAFQALCFKCGMLYYHKKDYENAYNTYQKITLKKYTETPLFTNNYALTLMGLKKWEEALKYLDIGVKKLYKDNPSTVNIRLANMANIYIEQGNYHKAKVFLDSAKNSLTKESELRNKNYIFTKYIDYYKFKGNFDVAFQYIDSIVTINKEILDRRVDEKLQALEVSYKREQRLNNDLKASKKDKLWLAIVLLLTFIALLSMTFFFKYKNIRSAHENILIEQKLLRSQMTPHFIFNSLSVLQGMILNKENNKAAKYLSKFSRLLRLNLENSREKFVPLKEELEAIQNYVDLQNMRNKSSFKYLLSLSEEIETLEFLIPPMLMQPFIENAIKHGFKKEFKSAKISIEITYKNTELICMIKDNGVGIDKSNAGNGKKSLSTKITSERLKLLTKDKNIESAIKIEDRSLYNEQGTQVTMVLPYKII